MTTQQEDFWGEIEVGGTQTPSLILKQQAALLGEKTKHMLEAKVRARASDGDFHYSFELVAPALDNYTYQLFQVRHGADLYPVFAELSPFEEKLMTENQFKDWVHNKLSSPDTKRIVANLLNLARS